MHTITGRCVKVVDETTNPKDGKEKKKYKVLQVLCPGLFTHQIKGIVQSVDAVSLQGQALQGISLLNNGGKYMKIDKVLDNELDHKYSPGKEVTIHAIPEIRINKGRPELFFRVVDPEDDQDRGESRLVSIRDWDNGKWQENKELNLNIKFRPFITKNGTGLDYAIQN